jgi:hypothetical protein
LDTLRPESFGLEEQAEESGLSEAYRHDQPEKSVWVNIILLSGYAEYLTDPREIF